MENEKQQCKSRMNIVMHNDIHFKQSVLVGFLRIA
jgi:hypothetical protein